MIQAVIFNLDGVLVATDGCHFQAWKQMAAEQGIPFSQEIYQRMRGMKRLDSLKILLKRAERTYSPGEMWALSARKNDLFNEQIERIDPSAILPGALDTLRRLQEMGVKTAVGSSSENAGGILRQLKMEDLLDAVVDGTDIEKGKPDPEAFLLIARKLNVPAGDCLVVENTAAGLEAAQAAGMKAISLEETPGCPADLTQFALPELIARENAAQNRQDAVT